ncbi:MAG: hypothetical protein QW555_08025 [Nitrososphaerota archaeon]
MPCPYRVKHNGVYFCGKRVPLRCAPDICPYSDLYYELVKNDRNSETVWLMPRQEKMRVDEALAIARSDATLYIIKPACFKIFSFNKR